MASLTGNLVAETYKALLKTIDNDILTASEKQITDGFGGGSNVFIDSNGFLRANKYKVTNGLATQFLKADGSLDANTYLTSITSSQIIAALGFTPVTNARTLTINGTTYDLSANRSWTVAGTAAIWGNITGTLSNQTDLQNALNAKFNNPTGTVSQYIRGDGSLAVLPTGGGGGGGSVSYYLNGSINQGTIGGVSYYEMNKVPIIGTGTDFSRNSNGYIASFLTDANDPNLLQIPAGNWNFETYLQASNGGGSPNFYIQLYKYDGTNFTLIASNSGTPKLINDGANIEAYYSALAVPETTLTLTDRLAVRIYVNTAGRTITMHTENGHLSEVITTFTTGLTALNGLTAQVQYLSTGTSGNDFNISSATNTHTFNLPTASAVNRGALSAADWIIFNAKQAQLSGTGFVKASGTTISYDNSTYLTTADAASTYQLLTNLSTDLTASATKYPSVNAVIAGLATKQPLDADLTAIAALAGTSGFLIKTAADTWALDTNTYLTTTVAASTYQRLDKMVSNLLASSTEYPNSNAVLAKLALKADAANPVFTGDLTISGATPRLYFVDTDQNPDYTIFVDSGYFYIYDQTAGATKFQITPSGNAINTGTLTSTSFIKSGGTSSQFLKADGSVDSNTYVTGGPFLPLAGGTMTGVITTPNNTFGIIVGDDSRLADRNIANTLFLEGIQNNDRGYINFSDTTGNALGAINGGALTWRGVAVATTANISGTTNYISKFTSANVIGNSLIYDDGTRVFINATSAPGFGSPKFFVKMATANSYEGILVASSSNDNAIAIAHTGTQGLITTNYGGSGANTTLSFGTNGVQQMNLFTTGNLGIGVNNTDSGFKLDVNGTGRFSGNLRATKLSLGTGTTTYPINVEDGTQSNSYFTLFNTIGTAGATAGLRFGIANGTLTTGGATEIVARGLTAADAAMDFKVLYNYSLVNALILGSNGAATFSNSISTTNGFISASYNAGDVIVWGGIGAYANLYGALSWDIDKAIIKGRSGYALGLYSDNSSTGSKGITILTSGNVGIGINTPTGTYGKLSVAGGISLLGDNNGKLEIDRYSVGASNSYIKLGSTSNSLRITNNTDAADLFIIENGGKVGIGTMSPAALTEINSGSIGNGGTAKFALALRSGTTTYFDIYQGYNSTIAGQSMFGTTLQSSDGLAFATSNIERMRIAIGGNVLIGTTTDSGHKLRVFGDGASFGNGSDFYQTINSGTTGSYYFIINGAIRQTIASTGAATFASSVTATSFFESSDSRLKKLIDGSAQIAGIENLQAKLYEKNGKIEYGYFAQDAQEFMPYAVEKNMDGFLSLSYREVHTAKIARLEQRVAELEKQLNAA